MNEYIEQAINFCKKNNVEIEISFSNRDKYFVGDTKKRDIYNVKIIRNSKSFEFKFGDSLYNTEKNTKIKGGKKTRFEVVKPSEYDILACLQKYDIGDFDDFVSDCGYSFNTEGEYIRIKKTYFEVKEEYSNVLNVFKDIMDELQEIQ